MRSRSFLSQVARYSAAILLSILLLPVIPGAASSPGQATLEAEGKVESWTRTLEPVIMSASQFPLFSGVTLGHLFVYKYAGGTWTQVPFQFDEVNSAGDYVASEDGLLDSNDQLVFMAKDLGSTAELYQWPDDLSAKSYSRYEVKVTNPLNAAEEGWVYLFRSATLTPTFSDYVTWDSVNSRIEAVSYTAIFSPTVPEVSGMIGLEGLELNGTGVDILDRQKLYLSGKCYDETGDWDEFAVFEDSEDVRKDYKPPTKHGPVRVGGGSLTEPGWSYAYTSDTIATFDASNVPGDCKGGITYSTFRISHDWLNPEETGMAPMTFYDTNRPAGVAVDGVMDDIPSTPVVPWQEVSGALGTLVQVATIATSGGQIRNYYWDLVEAVGDPPDTGDKHMYADAGFRVNNPTSVVTMTFTRYHLAANLGNVGNTYKQYRDNPLQAAATAQSYVNPAPSKIRIGWNPHPVFSGSEITFTAIVGAGLAPFTYEWTFGDDSSTASGNPVTHTFTATGAIPVTLVVANGYGTAAPVVRYVQVWEPGTELYLIYMPLALFKGNGR